MQRRFDVGQEYRDHDGDRARVAFVDGDEVVLTYPDKPSLGNIPWRQTDYRDGNYLGSLVPWPIPKENTNTMSTEAANEAKLEVAADHGLRAKFSYTNRHGETHDVRLEPSDVWTSEGALYVGGETFDEDGDSEGYKQYRVESINGSVVIR